MRDPRLLKKIFPISDATYREKIFSLFNTCWKYQSRTSAIIFFIVYDAKSVEPCRYRRDTIFLPLMRYRIGNFWKSVTQHFRGLINLVEAVPRYRELQRQNPSKSRKWYSHTRVSYLFHYLLRLYLLQCSRLRHCDECYIWSVTATYCNLHNFSLVNNRNVTSSLSFFRTSYIFRFYSLKCEICRRLQKSTEAISSKTTGVA